VYSLVIQEESNNVVFPASVSLYESSITMNASNARKIQNHGKGSANGASD